MTKLLSKNDYKALVVELFEKANFSIYVIL